MGILDLFRKKESSVTLAAEPPVQESEKQYYQEDSYYTEKAFPDTPFERTVVTFEQRKKTCIPSASGLYVAEILLLYYCSKGKYPNPPHGYPGFWWFEYGIRNVGNALSSLENRGYIQFKPIKDSIDQLTMPKLKELLLSFNQSTSGKKADLVHRVADTVPEDRIIAAGVERRYELTEKGLHELDENAYVPYMHSSKMKTFETNDPDYEFNVWSINRLLGSGDKSKWLDLVDVEEEKFRTASEHRHKIMVESIKDSDPDTYKLLKAQDDQIKRILAADKQYVSDKNADLYISFLEGLWNNEGLIIEGSHWVFRLVDLYISSQRNDDAIQLLLRIKKEKPQYAQKADAYLKRLNN